MHNIEYSVDPSQDVPVVGIGAQARAAHDAARQSLAQAASLAKPGAPQRGQLTTWVAITEFLLAGNAVFTLRSLKTGARFTYRVRVKKEDRNSLDPTYFVCWLRGPDNTSDWGYVGVLRLDLGLRLTSASRVSRNAAVTQGLVWFLDAMKHKREVLGAQLEFWHEGRCCRCGRRLTVPESVADGLGPECRKAA